MPSHSFFRPWHTPAHLSTGHRHLAAELDALIVERSSLVRYAVIFPVSPRSNGFYDFARGIWAWNCIPETAMFKTRAIAEAAARALRLERRERRKTSVLFPPQRDRVQTVELRIGSRRLLQAVQTRHSTYIPLLTATPHLAPVYPP